MTKAHIIDDRRSNRARVISLLIKQTQCGEGAKIKHCGEASGSLTPVAERERTNLPDHERQSAAGTGLVRRLVQRPVERQLGQHEATGARQREVVGVWAEDEGVHLEHGRVGERDDLRSK